MESADTASKSGFGGVVSSLDFASTHPANSKRIRVSRCCLPPSLTPFHQGRRTDSLPAAFSESRTCAHAGPREMAPASTGPSRVVRLRRHRPGVRAFRRERGVWPSRVGCGREADGRRKDGVVRVGLRRLQFGSSHSAAARSPAHGRPGIGTMPVVSNRC